MDRKELHRLQVENLSQREELNRLVVKLEDLRQEMVVLAQNDAKVRVMAKLSAPKGDSIAGVGGPAREDDVNREFNEIQQRIDDVRRQIDLRRESQEEIKGILNEINRPKSDTSFFYIFLFTYIIKYLFHSKFIIIYIKILISLIYLLNRRIN